MENSEKKFSKAKWLEFANADKEAGILTQREIDDAIKIWVNDNNGKTKSELTDANGQCMYNEEWFV